MSGRIRTLKPEWLEDEKLAALSDGARLLSAALMLMADDHGRGRASIATIASETWRYELERNDGANAPETLAKASRALRELVEMRFVILYTVDGQRYFAIRNWTKHQKVDRPGKERVPAPPTAENLNDSVTAPAPREGVASPSRESRENLATDLRSRSPISIPTTSVRARDPGDPAKRENLVRSVVSAALIAAGRPAPPLDTSSKCHRIAEWCGDHATATGSTFDDVLDRLARGFAAAAGKTAKAGWPIGYLAQNPGEYIRLAPSNPALGGGETDAELLADLRRHG